MALYQHRVLHPRVRKAMKERREAAVRATQRKRKSLVNRLIEIFTDAYVETLEYERMRAQYAAG